MIPNLDKSNQFKIRIKSNQYKENKTIQYNITQQIKPKQVKTRQDYSGMNT